MSRTYRPGKRIVTVKFPLAQALLPGDRQFTDSFPVGWFRGTTEEKRVWRKQRNVRSRRMAKKEAQYAE